MTEPSLFSLTTSDELRRSLWAVDEPLTAAGDESQRFQRPRKHVDPSFFDPFIYDGVNPVVSDGFILGSASLSESGSGTVVAFPTLDEGAPFGFFGPNLAGTPVPGPLPALGAVSALAWSRRLRHRIRVSARPNHPETPKV